MRAFAVAVALGLLVAGCAGGNRDRSGGAENRASLGVKLDEFAVVPDFDSVDDGRIRLEVTNAGELAHNLRVIRTDAAPGGLPVRGAQVDEEASVLTVVASTKTLQPKQMRVLAVRLTPGTYVLICNLPGHYQSGMRAALEVES